MGILAWSVGDERTTAVPRRLVGLKSATGSSRRKRIRCARDPKRTASPRGPSR